MAGLEPATFSTLILFFYSMSLMITVQYCMECVCTEVSWVTSQTSGIVVYNFSNNSIFMMLASFSKTRSAHPAYIKIYKLSVFIHSAYTVKHA